MKRLEKIVLAAITICVVAVFGSCATPGVKVVPMETKGTATGAVTPEWVNTYIEKGISAVQALPQFKDKYCIVGEETGVNKQFVLAWADNFSAQQRIGAMLRTNIETKYQATVNAQAESSGVGTSGQGQNTAYGDYKQEIDNSINSVVNVSYSGAQLEANWWVLQRRYDPDQKDVYNDEYVAYVLYTIPKAELNRQIASALETSVSKDSQLYDITIQLAKDILLDGIGDIPPVVENESSAGNTTNATLNLNL
ncbi:MAG: hypothetical protein LBM77_07030 [Spirochaetaceae bacterium]|jgi:hypothetical protein|nr:hypothetical protein [Spirochaetaceae bacterium]